MDLEPWTFQVKAYRCTRHEVHAGEEERGVRDSMHRAKKDIQRLEDRRE
jgi:hypothetical protein